MDINLFNLDKEQIKIMFKYIEDLNVRFLYKDKIKTQKDISNEYLIIYKTNLGKKFNVYAIRHNNKNGTKMLGSIYTSYNEKDIFNNFEFFVGRLKEELRNEAVVYLY